ncbi:MAG: glycosyltransferase, partial [Bacteroidia bacterium]
LKELDLQQSDLIFRSAERQEVPTYLSIADLCIFFIRPSYSKLASSPTKLAEIAMMGKRYVTNPGVGDVEQITREGNCGLIVGDFSSEEYEKAAKQALNLNAVVDPGISNYARNRFALSSGVKKYADIYKKIMEE